MFLLGTYFTSSPTKRVRCGGPEVNHSVRTGRRPPSSRSTTTTTARRAPRPLRRPPQVRAPPSPSGRWSRLGPIAWRRGHRGTVLDAASRTAPTRPRHVPLVAARILDADGQELHSLAAVPKRPARRRCRSQPAPNQTTTPTTTPRRMGGGARARPCRPR